MKKTFTILFYLLTINLVTKAQVNHWAAKFGGLSTDEVMDICKDGSGNIISVGYFSSNMPLTGYTLTSVSSGVPDVFVSKTDVSGTLQWIVRAGGNGSDRPSAVCADVSGNIYVTGTFYGSASFGNTVLHSVNGSQDIFVAKIDPYGNFLWAFSAGGQDNDIVHAIATDGKGSVLLTGEFQGSSTFGTQTLISQVNPITGQSSFDVFVAKFNTSGNLIWIKQGKASKDDRGLGIDCDGNGNVLVCGQFSDAMTFQNTHPNQIQNAVFLLKLDSLGQELWFRKAGASYSIANDLVVDHSGNIYMTGDCHGNMCFYDQVNYYMNHPLHYRVYIAKYSPAGQILWAKCDGSQNEISARNIALDVSQNPYMYGTFKCRFTDYSNAFGSATFSSLGFNDLFICKYNSMGIRQWFRHAGGKMNDEAHGLTFLEDDEPVMGGSYAQNINFPITGSVFYPSDEAKLIGCNSTYCNDSEYGQFLSFNFMGYLDGFVCKLLNPQRQPMDSYNRAGTGCARDTILMSLSPVSRDTIGICVNEYIYPYTHRCHELEPIYRYSWNGGTFDTISRILVNQSGYNSLRIKTLDGCSLDEDTVYIQVKPKPPVPLISDGQTVNVGAIQTQSLVLCSPDSVSLWTINSSGYSVSWILPNRDTIFQNTIYAKNISWRDTVIFTETNGCTSKNWITVKSDYSPKPLHLITQMPDSFVVCQGDTLSYVITDSLSPTGCLHLNEIKWDLNQHASLIPFGFDSLLASYCSASVKIVADTTGWYHLKGAFIYHNTCGTDTAYFDKSIFIKVNFKPTAHETVSGNFKLCLGDSTLISFNTFTSACSNCVVQADPPHRWYYDYGIYGYGVSVTDTTTGCYFIFNGSFNIMSKPDPYLTLSPANGIVCPNDSVHVTCHPNQLQLINYEWYGPNGKLSNTNSDLYVKTPGMYYSIVMDADSCVFTSNTVEVKEYNTPYLVGLPGNVICNGEPIKIKVISNDSTLIQWMSPFSGGGTSQLVTQPGTYSCEVSMCSITTTCSITVYESSPTVSLNMSGSYTICPGDSILLSASQGSFHYQWSNGMDTTQSVKVYSGGVYYTQIIDSLGCQVYSDSLIIALDTSVVKPLVDGDTVCLGNNVIIHASSQNVIEWYTQPYGGTPIYIGSDYTLNSIQQDTIFYVCSYDSVNSCRSLREPVKISISPYSWPPSLFIDTLLCVGDTIHLYASDFPPQANIHWMGPSSWTSHQDSIVISPATEILSGNYSVWIDGEGCVSDTITRYIQVRGVNVLLGNDTVLCHGLDLTLNAGHHVSYLWQDASVDSIFLINQGVSGAYYVQVTDSFGCQASDTIHVTFVTCADKIPNVFTPNGDGINDVFSMTLYSGQQFSMEIYDRWGKIVAKLDPEHPTWDGKSLETGEMLHECTLFYTLEIMEKYSEQLKKEKGFIVLQK